MGQRSSVRRRWGSLAVAPWLLLLPCISGWASCQSLPPPSSQLPDPYRISVDVDLVVLQATVRDRNGRFAQDLRQKDFAIFEDGIPQVIRLFRWEDVPVTVGLVIDHSGSMLHRLNYVIAAARTFARSSNQEDRMFVVNFNERASLGLPPTVPFTNRPVELESAILKSPAAGQTALYDAIGLALSQLRASNQDKNVLIIISDGGDNASSLRRSEVLRIAGQSNALLYTIGIYDEEDPDKNPGVLRQLARSTGGEAYFPQAMDEVVDICERIAHEIRSQYTLGYVSTKAERNGSYRKILVEARSEDHHKLAVRARTGYVARGASKPVAQGEAK